MLDLVTLDAAGRSCRAGEVATLDTGDLGYPRDGFLYLTSRTKRIVKIFGLRYSLDELRDMAEFGQRIFRVAETSR